MWVPVSGPERIWRESKVGSIWPLIIKSEERHVHCFQVNQHSNSQLPCLLPPKPSQDLLWSQGLPWGEDEHVCDTVWAWRSSSAVWFFLVLRSGFMMFIFLGRPRFRPAIFLPFLLNFFLRALDGDGFLTALAPRFFSSSAPSSF